MENIKNKSNYTYRGRTKFLVRRELQEEFIEFLSEKFPETRMTKIHQLAFDEVGMSKTLWIRWLTPEEMFRFLIDEKTFYENYTEPFEPQIDEFI